MTLVERFLSTVIVYSVISEYTLEICPSSAISVAELLEQVVIYGVIAEHILERNPANVLFVV